MDKITVMIHDKKVGELFYENRKKEFGFNYTNNIAPVSLIMPYRNNTYIWKEKLHPIFDMNMPEGYLFEIFKNFLTKEYGYIDDFLIFSYLCENIQSRIKYKSSFKTDDFQAIDIKEILKNDTKDTFQKILEMFLSKNAISGIQPKTLAILEDKSTLSIKEYIIKTWGEEYPQLALNEYFCLKAVQSAGVKIPNIILSENNNFLLVERFNYDKDNDKFLGFEEVLVLMGKNRDQKYSGSYESIAKLIYTITTNKKEAMESLYKTIVMSYLLKNGDAHLKNFGVIYDDEMKKISFAPAYDIVTTCAYIYKDRPALTMFGKKVWYGKKELLRFGQEYCYLKKEDALKFYKECINALKKSIKNLEKYLLKIEEENDFEIIGARILDIWKISLDEKTYKEISDETIRNWS